jgi:CRISPR/Cas system-associated exonuclease Cas4 (RecB family)
MPERAPLISAAEVGEYVFCSRSWQLRAMGCETEPARPRLAAGTQYHEQHGHGVERSRSLSQAARFSLIVAFLLALFLLLFQWLRL